MARERTAVNFRISARERDEINALVESGAYPSVSAFGERAFQHLLDHEKGLVVEGGPAMQRELAALLESDGGRRLLKELVDSFKSD